MNIVLIIASIKPIKKAYILRMNKKRSKLDSNAYCVKFCGYVWKLRSIEKRYFLLDAIVNCVALLTKQQ